MRFLIDTNILLHGVNPDGPAYAAAHRFLQEHLENQDPWCTTWPIVYEFLRVSTHRSVFPRPLKAKQALAFVASLLSGEEVTLLTETARHAAVLESVVSRLGHPAGNLFHDIHTATLMREHGVPEIITADTDFLQFGFLKVTNPLLR